MRIQNEFKTNYEEGQAFAAKASNIEQVAECPHPQVEATHPDCGKRQAWMCGFLDFRFQAICDKHGIGEFGKNEWN